MSTAQLRTPMISRFERWAPIAGIVFVLLMVGGGFLVSDVPDSDAANRRSPVTLPMATITRATSSAHTYG